ncbi:MAG: hypothetical protein AMJ91_02055 [candidate division Zixibacteria bacterium SM23_73_3]|nr:MAG: hypothetical protein AMJ91_02055 [candidate division Zixibacteria bacterium SM23_73_3]
MNRYQVMGGLTTLVWVALSDKRRTCKSKHNRISLMGWNDPDCVFLLEGDFKSEQEWEQNNNRRLI